MYIRMNVVVCNYVSDDLYYIFKFQFLLIVFIYAFPALNSYEKYKHKLVVCFATLKLGISTY